VKSNEITVRDVSFSVVRECLQSWYETLIFTSLFW